MIDINQLRRSEVTKNFTIPPKPEILVRLHSIMHLQEPELMVMADLVAQDVGLASAVIKTINSVYYGLRRQVSDIRQAAILLGAYALVNLVTSYELRKALSAKTCISLERFWDCAGDVARISSLLVQQLDLRIPIEDVYMAGLFHDCGIPIMAMRHTDYQEVLIEANSNYDEPMTSIERRYYGVDHSMVGYQLADSWDLPLPICQTILQNHERDLWQQCQDPQLLRMVAVLKFAENVSDRIRRHCENPDWVHHKSQVLQQLEIGEERCKEVERSIGKRLCEEAQRENEDG